MIRQACIDDSKIVEDLAVLLWPDNDIYDLEKEMIDSITSEDEAVFIYYKASLIVINASKGSLSYVRFGG